MLTKVKTPVQCMASDDESVEEDELAEAPCQAASQALASSLVSARRVGAIFETESEAENSESIQAVTRESLVPRVKRPKLSAKQRAKSQATSERVANEHESLRRMVFQSLMRGVQTSSRAAHLAWQQPLQGHVQAALAIRTIQRTALLALLCTIRACQDTLVPVLFSEARMYDETPWRSRVGNMNEEGEIVVDDEAAKVMACTLQFSMLLRPATPIKHEPAESIKTEATESANVAESTLSRRVVVPSRVDGFRGRVVVPSPLNGVKSEAGVGVKQENIDAPDVDSVGSDDGGRRAGCQRDIIIHGEFLTLLAPMPDQEGRTILQTIREHMQLPADIEQEATDLFQRRAVCRCSDMHRSNLAA